MRNVLLIVMVMFAGGCGTVRYSLVGEKGKRGHQEVAWDVVKIDFNSFWLKLAGKEK